MRTVLMKCARSHMHTRVCSANLELLLGAASPPAGIGLRCGGFRVRMPAISAWPAERGRSCV
jgi:hypothetical protein